MLSTAARAWVMALLLAATSTSLFASGPPPTRVLTEAQQEIATAAMTKDPLERLTRLRTAIRAGLFSPTKETSDQVFEYLTENYGRIDLRPFEDVLKDFSRVYRLPDQVHALMDDSQLLHGTREERIEVLRKAIVAGEFRLPHGRKIPRELAMWLAASEGIDALEPVIQTYSGQVDERWKQAFGFQSFASLFELKRGGRDAEDSNRLAVSRIEAMADDELHGRVTADRGFGEAVLRVTEQVCGVSPASTQRSPGCGQLRDVYLRQARLERASRLPQGKQSGGQAPINEWLEKLDTRTRPIGQRIPSASKP
jgi:hypothetical protein